MARSRQQTIRLRSDRFAMHLPAKNPLTQCAPYFLVISHQRSPSLERTEKQYPAGISAISVRAKYIHPPRDPEIPGNLTRHCPTGVGVKTFDIAQGTPTSFSLRKQGVRLFSNPGSTRAASTKKCEVPGSLLATFATAKTRKLAQQQIGALLAHSARDIGHTSRQLPARHHRPKIPLGIFYPRRAPASCRSAPADQLPRIEPNHLI